MFLHEGFGARPHAGRETFHDFCPLSTYQQLSGNGNDTSAQKSWNCVMNQRWNRFQPVDGQVNAQHQGANVMFQSCTITFFFLFFPICAQIRHVSTVNAA